MIENFKDQKIHFIGIGGISMSALAKLLLSQGAIVTGSDAVHSHIITELIDLGADVCIGSYTDASAAADLVIYTAAIGKTDPDLQAAAKSGVMTLERAEFLGYLAGKYAECVGISGTHGKTTTTAMIAYALKKARKNPTVHLGGESRDLGSNLVIGGKKFFVTEACEFNKSFLHLSPTVSVICNIERDHMDCYTDMDDIDSTFLQFANQTRHKVILCGDNIGSQFIQKIDKFKVVTYGLDPKNEFYAQSVENMGAYYKFDCFHNGEFLGEIKLNVPGRHNIVNALACVAVCTYYKIKFETIKEALESFSGVGRRFEVMFDKGNVRIIHDYAHHPTEIATSLDTARDLEDTRRLICVFEPHTYTRTLALMEEFTHCFNKADKLYIIPTYSARENFIAGGSALDLFYSLPQGMEAEYFEHVESVYYELKKDLKAGDVILWLGAGTIYNFAQEFVKEL